MKLRIARYLMTAVGMTGLAGTPALLADNLHRDFRNLGRENADIRADRYRLHEDVERGRYRAAARERADINRDYSQRQNQIRDIRRDERRRYDWR